MESQLNAFASTAGALISGGRFLVPDFQREYAWLGEEYSEFWNDLQRSLSDDTYFLGLVILTSEDDRLHVVDGQQRLLTITLLAAALRHEALRHQRVGLADQIETTFLKVLDYDSDSYTERISLTGDEDNATLQLIISDGDLDASSLSQAGEKSVSVRMLDAYTYLRSHLQADLSHDPFKRLGSWARFITDKLYFAVFVHPAPGAAYRVFEVINTRGRELTTADLLKNYLLSQTPSDERSDRYKRWQAISRRFPLARQDAFVPFIRHVVNLTSGYVLPRDLYDFLSQRRRATAAPSINDLLVQMEAWLPMYLQLLDPTVDGPSTPEQLRVFAAMNDLDVSAVRPLLMAISTAPDADEGMKQVLQIVARRSVVGNLGTGSAERRFGESAQVVYRDRRWRDGPLTSLAALDATEPDFIEQLRKRSLNKGVLQFIRRSVVQDSITPEPVGYLQLLRPRASQEWLDFAEDDVAYWGSTIGNTFLSTAYRRPRDTGTWAGVRENLLSTGVPGEFQSTLDRLPEWTPASVEVMGKFISERAAHVWF